MGIASKLSKLFRLAKKAAPFVKDAVKAVKAAKNKD